MTDYDKTITELTRELYNKYHNYYCTVDFNILVEAVENSINDLFGVCNIEDLHEHIKENYI